MVNARAIESTILIGLALNCSIASWCRFARKNYFYPDMPKNYQISQYDEPLCTDGWLDVPVPTDDGIHVVRVEIERVHMEEDTGKLTHSGGATGRIHGADHSLVDYNRAGIPLVEIVTKTVAGTGALAPAVARAYVATLRDLVKSLGVSDVRMEEGSLRCDANLSLAPAGRALGHPDRDQERQLPALGRAGGALRDRAAGGRAGRRAGRSTWRRGTSTRTPAAPRPAGPRSRPRTTATSPSPTWCPWPRTRTGSSGCGPACRRTPPPGAPGCRPAGGSATSTWLRW